MLKIPQSCNFDRIKSFEIMKIPQSRTFGRTEGPKAGRAGQKVPKQDVLPKAGQLRSLSTNKTSEFTTKLIFVAGGSTNKWEPCGSNPPGDPHILKLVTQ